MSVWDVEAKSFDVTHSVDDAMSAAGFSIQYEDLLSDLTFDPAKFAGITPYHQEDDPDIVRVRFLFGGILRDLIYGVVDRNGMGGEGGPYVGALIGRDLMALALDRKPDEAFAYNPGQAFKDAFRDLAERAGLSVSFFCDDYALAEALSLTRDQAYVEGMQSLLAPFRFGEKHRVDAWIDGSVITVAKRNYAAPPRGTVTIDAERLVLVRMEKTRGVGVDDVAVFGGMYRTVIQNADYNSGFPRGQTTTEHTVHSVDWPGTPPPGATNPKEYWTEDTTEQVDDEGRPIYKDVVRVYTQLNGRMSVRTEHVREDYEYYEVGVPASSPYFGKKKRSESYKDIYDVWSVKGGGTYGGYVRVNEIVEAIVYYDDNGDTKYQETSELERDVTKPVELSGYLPVRVNRLTKIRWTRMGRQLEQEKNVLEYSEAGALVNAYTMKQVGPYTVVAQSDLVVGANDIVQDNQYYAGPDLATFTGTLRKEESRLLNNAGCALIRGQLQDEQGSTKVTASFRTPYDPQIAVGKLLVVANPPSAWGALTSFYITSVRLTFGTGMDCDIDGLAWVAEP